MLPHGFGKHEGRLGLLQLKSKVVVVNADYAQKERRSLYLTGDNKSSTYFAGEIVLTDKTPGMSSITVQGQTHNVPLDNTWYRAGHINQGDDSFDVYVLHYEKGQQPKKFPWKPS